MQSKELSGIKQSLSWPPGSPARTQAHSPHCLFCASPNHRSHSPPKTGKFWPTWRKRFDNKTATQINFKSLKSSSYFARHLERVPRFRCNLRLWRSVIRYKTTSFHGFKKDIRIPYLRWVPRPELGALGHWFINLTAYWNPFSEALKTKTKQKLAAWVSSSQTFT